MNSKKIINELKKLSSKFLDIEHMIVYSYLKMNNVASEKSIFFREYFTEVNMNLCIEAQSLLSSLLSFELEQLVELFEFLIPEKSKKENGVVYTPEMIRKHIVDSAFRTKTPPVVLDPACGCGAFLVTAAKRIHEKYNLKYSEIYKKNIFGVDIDKEAIRKTKILLALLACTNEEYDINSFNLICANTLNPSTSSKLKKICPDGFDCVVGNPPYVRFRNISETSKKFLLRWETSSVGNVDLYMPFFEIGLKVLSDNGVLGYITPNSYIQSVNGRKLRSYLTNKKYSINVMDFRETQIFKNVTSYTCITLIERGVQSQTIKYVRINNLDTLDNYKFSEYDIASFPDGSPWRMRNNDIDLIINKLETAGIPLSNWKIRNGLATLMNDLYFFKPESEDDKYFYRMYEGKKYKIEKNICIKIAKPNVIKSEKELSANKEQAIFPYAFENGFCSIMPEKLLSEVYPYAYKFLCEYKWSLNKRDKGKGKYAAWYAYGRTQGMNNFGKKLLLPYIAGEPVAVLCLDEKLLFYCGYAIISDDERELRILKCFLESEAFWYYIYHTSKPYSKGYMAFAKNYIVKFSIPKLTENEVKFLLSAPPKRELNNWIWQKYGVEPQ